MRASVVPSVEEIKKKAILMKMVIFFHRKKGIGPRQEIGRRDPPVSGLVNRVDLRSAMNHFPHGYREIAEILGSSIRNLKRQLHRARRRLRELRQDNISSMRICWDSA